MTTMNVALKNYTIIIEQKKQRVIRIVEATSALLIEKKNLELLEKYPWPKYDIIFARYHGMAELRSQNPGYSNWDEVTVESLINV